MPVARLAQTTDLASLLDLFAVSEVSETAQPGERAEAIWRETLAQPGLYVFVSGDGGLIGATCTLVTAPNLLRSGRRHGFLENVVTHPSCAAAAAATAGRWSLRHWRMPGRSIATTC